MSNLESFIKTLARPKPPSATQRHAIATERHIDDVCKERDRMARELVAVREAHDAAMRELRTELMVIINDHRERLDWFEPQYEGLKRDDDTIKALNFSSLFMITLGSVLIGTASFFASDVLKFSALASGALATAYGLWAQWLIVSRSPASRERPVILRVGA